MGKHTFDKTERLHRDKHIQELFDKGSSFYLFPFKVFVIAKPEQASSPNQVLVSVSTRNFKRAADRNLIKRRIREAYRLQKEALPKDPPVMAAFIYAHKEILSFDEMKSRLLSVLKRIPKNVKLPQ
jgi:ribonuclease P protein component